jgi:hypothetical protein
MSSTPFWKLRRLAQRSRRVQTRRASDAPVIAAYGTTLNPRATAYITAYDAAAKYQTKWRKEMKEGKGAIAGLVKTIRAWLPLVARDVPGFDASTFADQPDVPDDVLEDGDRLLSEVEDFKDAEEKPLAYQEAAIKELGPALQAANKEWAEAEAADKLYQDLLKDVRETAAVFDPELQAFRRSLSTVFGRSDKDFQKLRAERAGQADEDDDPNAPQPPSPLPTA